MEPVEEETPYRIEFTLGESSLPVFGEKVVISPSPIAHKPSDRIFQNSHQKLLTLLLVFGILRTLKINLVSSTCYKEARRTLPTTMDCAAVSFPKA